MAIIAWWNNHQFEISPAVIRGFTDLQITGSAETEDKTGGGEKYVSWKNTNPTELTITAHLNAYFGCDVRTEAMRFIIEARWGENGYFYAYYNNQWSKLLPYKMMLTAASVTKVEMAPTGKWISADVQLTLKSCTVSDDNTGYWGGGGSSGGGSYSGGGGGYSKTSVNTTSTTTSTTTTKIRNEVLKAEAKDEKTNKKNTTSTATKTITKITNDAKQKSKTTGTTITKGTTKTGGGGGKVVAMTK